jgi:APA family basic amino acid/polyamine antiporter
MVFFGYLGFDAITAIAEESLNPKWDIPRAIVTNTFVVGTLYFLVAIVITGIHTMNGILPEIATAEVFNKVGAKFLATVVYIGGFFGLVSVTYSCFLVQVRVFAAIGWDGLLPTALAKLSSFTWVPVQSSFYHMIVLSVVTFFFSLEDLAQMISVGNLISYGCINACCLALWYRGPLNTNWTVKAEGFVWVFYFLAILLGGMIDYNL